MIISPKFKSLSYFKSLALILVLFLLTTWSSSAQQLISVAFDKGAVGTKGSNSQDLTNLTNFQTLLVNKAYFIQNSSVNIFQIQGNDISGTLRLVTNTSNFVDIPGAMVWSDNGNASFREFMGFLPSPNLVSFNLSNFGGLNYIIDNTRNFALGFVNKNKIFTDGASVGGNASSPINALNDYLATFNAARPLGPVTVTSLTTSSANPTLTGSTTLASGEMLSIELNGVVYTTGITYPTATTWSWTVPNTVSLTAGTYDVVATITNTAGYTLSDNTTDELVVSNVNFADLGCITIVLSGGADENSTWTYANNTITPNSATAVSLNVEDVIAKMALGDLKIESSCITVSTAVAHSSNGSSLTLGRVGSTNTVVINGAITVAGPVTAYGGNIALNESITTSTNTGHILIKAAGNIRLLGEKTLSTQGANVVLWSNSVGGTTLGEIVLQSNFSGATGARIQTNGGHIWLGGGSGTTTWNGITVGNGYAVSGSAIPFLGSSEGPIPGGVFFQGAKLLSEGGNIYVGGQSQQSNSRAVLTTGPVEINSGTGTIEIQAIATTLAGALGTGWHHDSSKPAMNGNLTIISANATSSAILLNADATASNVVNGDLLDEGSGLAGVVSLRTTNGGGLVYNSLGSSARAAAYGLRLGYSTNQGGTLELLSNSGNITLNTGNRSIFLSNNLTNTTLGFKAATPITASTSQVTLVTNDLSASGALNFNTSGQLIIEPFGSSFTSPVNTTQLIYSAGVTGLTIGKVGNTAEIIIGSAATVAGPITAYGGNITVDGNLNTSAGNANGDILLKGTGNITQNASRTITTNGGDVTLWSDSDATGTATTAGGTIALLNASSITSNGGNITLGGGADGNADGIPDGYAIGAYIPSARGAVNSTAGLSLDNATLNAGIGNVLLRGQGVGNDQNFQIGTRLYGGSITGANITIDAIGSIQGPSSSSWGLSLEGFSIEGTGTISLTGKGGRAGQSNSDYNQAGVEIRPALDNSSDHSQIRATGTGTILINGQGGSGSFASHNDPNSLSAGIRIQPNQTAPILSASGAIMLNGTSGYSGRGSGMIIGSPITSTSGNVTLKGLRSVEGTTNLNGNIEINGTVTTGGAITLESPGAVTQTAAITGGNLGLIGTGTFTLTNTSNNLATVAGGTNAARLGSLSLTDSSGGLTIGTVGSNSGLTATGAILVETLADDLTISENITTDNATANAIVINAGKSTAIGTITGGDIILNGTPTVATGANGIAKLFSGSETASTGLSNLAGGSSNVRFGVDETTTTFTPPLTNGNIYALYRIATPNAPTNLVATASDGEVEIAFTAGADGGSAITNYEYSLDGGTTWIPFNPAITSSPVTISGLTNGTAYTIQLRAVNAIGAGAASTNVSATPISAVVTPSITLFTPIIAGKGESVVITGTGFTGATAVNFGNQAATSFVVDSDTQITAVVGNGASGSITVTNTAGADQERGFIYKIVEYKFENNTLDNTDANLDATVVGTASYAQGASGQAICFTNTNATNATTVQNYLTMPSNLIRNRAANFTISLRFKTSTWGAILGYQNRGVGDPNGGDYVPILYIQQDGKLSANLWQNIGNVGSPIRVLSVNRVDDGNWHKVEFSAASGSIFIYLDDVLVGSSNGSVNHLSMSFNQLAAANTAGTIWPGVPVGGWLGFTGCIDEFMILDESLTANQIQQVTALPLPTITSFTPTTAQLGTSVTITGTNFTGATSVVFGGVAAQSFTVVSDTEITATVPANASQNTTIQVITAGGTATASGFTFVSVPAAPTNLTTTAGDGEVEIAFTAGANGGSPITNYEYTLDGGTTWIPFNPAVTTSPVTISGLTNGTASTIQLRAVNAIGGGAASASITSTPLSPVTVPSAPTNLVATPKDGALELSFTAGNDGGSAITNYEYSLDGGTTWIALNPAAGTSPVTIPGLTNGTAYTLALRAVNAQGASAASTSATSSPATTPAAPSNLVATPKDGALELSFIAGNDGGSAITNYEYSLDSGTTWIALNPADGTSPATIPGLTNGTAYTLALRAVNAQGVSLASTSVASMPKRLLSSGSIVIESILDQTYSGLSITPNLTINDGSDALVVGTAYTVQYANNINTGIATVTINGIGRYSGTRSVNFTIEKAKVTITAENKSKVYGSANPALTFTYTGLVNGDTKVATEPSIATTATASSNVGTYPITLTGGSDSNYEIELVAGTLTVSKKALTITAENKSKVYGSENPALTFTYTGLVNGDTKVTTEPSIATTATASSNVGTYPITLTGGSDSNYEIELVVGTLTVSKKALTITAENKSKVYGSANPALTFTYTGLVNGDTKVTTEPSIATTATASSNVGTYPITLTGGSDANYDISGIAGELKVTQATLIIKAADQSKVYDLEDPTFTYTVTGLLGSDQLTGRLARDAGEAVGKYTITLGTLTGGNNYQITYTTAELEIIPTEIEEIYEIGTLQMNWGAVADLPVRIALMATNGRPYFLDVTWNQATLNRFRRGTYDLVGEVAETAWIKNPDALLSAIKVTVLPKPAPLDILLSNNSFAGAKTSEEIAIGTISVVDPVDGIHIPGVPYGLEDNRYFRVINDVLYWSSEDPAAGRTTFKIVIRVTDRDFNSLDKVFTIERSRKSVSSIEIYNTFTPEGDRINDTWGVPDLRYYRNVRMQIFDKGGERMFYTENPDIRWDGSLNGKALPIGTYYWTIEVGETGEVRKGMLNLLRK